MKTFLVMYFGTKEVSPSTIAKKLEALGFETNYGPYDFIHDWKGQTPTKGEVLALGDKVAEVLKHSGAVFNLDTHD